VIFLFNVIFQDIDERLKASEEADKFNTTVEICNLNSFLK
jgi:hypothetical protein